MIEKITSSQQAMDLEAKYGAHNYHPLPVVLAKGKVLFSRFYTFDRFLRTIL